MNTPLTLATLETPCLLVDPARMDANLARMRARADKLNIILRPHMKSAKSIEAVRGALPSPNGPATVSTLKEAEVFGASGVSDLLYAVCVSPQKLARVSALRAQGIDLKILVDSPAAAEAVAEQARQTRDPIPTLIEVDVDGHRSGVPYDDEDALVEIGARLQAGAELRGVLCHAGDSYLLSEGADLARAAERERARIAFAAAALRRHGLPCPVVSVGSTPTGLSAENYDGVTELRAGVYMFFDLFQAGVGVCSTDDIAVSVLATVIGRRPDKGWILVDAGWTALSSDRGTASQAVDQYYGLVCDLQGRPYDGVVVLRANQEHGIIAVRPGAGGTLPDLQIGDRVRILPNHACATASQHDAYHVVDSSGTVETTWSRFRGW